MSGAPETAELAAAIKGQVLTPGDPGYDEARTVWNAMIDRRPEVIARCTNAADVQAALSFARTRSCPLAVRSGGHSIAGYGVCDGGVVIDLSGMKAIQVDPDARTARAEPGLSWAEFDRETQRAGLATTGGVISTTGIAGLTLGGGIGWLMRKHGLTCDNLISAEVVAADGRLLTASEEQNEDLFWALRGGGGNFGVVTSFEYRLHPVGPTVTAGALLFPAERAPEVLRSYRDYAAASPDDITTMPIFMTAPDEDFIPEELRTRKTLGLLACHAGPLEDGEEVIGPLRELGPAGDLVQPMPYVDYQQMWDAGAPPGVQNYWKSEYLPELSDAAIDTLVEAIGEFRSPYTQVHVHHMEGMVSSVAPDATAFAHRDAAYTLNVFSVWEDPAESDEQIAWTRSVGEAMQPHSTGAGYVNFLTEEGEERVRATYGANYDRLARLKHEYEPDNIFSLNQNVAPAG